MARRIINIILGSLAFSIFPSSLRVFFNRLKGVSIGKNTFIGKYVMIDDANAKLISIGNNCGIATGVVILAHRRLIVEYSIDKGYNDYPFFIKEVKINDNVQIGAKSIILPGVEIGKGSIVGAGSVVTKSIPPQSLAFGSPAKVVKTLQ